MDIRGKFKENVARRKMVRRGKFDEETHKLPDMSPVRKISFVDRSADLSLKREEHSERVWFEYLALLQAQKTVHVGHCFLLMWTIH